MPDLISVSLEHCSQFNKEEQLLCLTTLSNLTELNLSFCRSLQTPNQLSFISRFSNLSYINISGCQAIGQTFVTEMSSLMNLRHLELKGVRTTSASLSIFTTLTNITYLDFTRCPRIMTEAIDYLSKLTNLTFLSLAGCDQLSANCFQNLTNLTNLLTLDVGFCKLAAGLSHISNFSNLTWLSLWKNRVTNDTLRSYAKLTNLTYLDLGETTINAGGLVHLTPFKNLRYLDLRQTHITEEKAREELKDLFIPDLYCLPKEDGN